MIYDKNTLEFVTVAVEFCGWLEGDIAASGWFRFVDRATKLLPLLYLKVALLPETPSPDEEGGTGFITEETYDALRARIAGLLGEHDCYLDTFMPDMAGSDTPIIAFISENLADMYQDLGNFAYLFRQGHEATMSFALSLCMANFRQFWGQSLLNALKALHVLRHNEDIYLSSGDEA